MYKDYNDYELIYLIHEHNEKATKALINKYEKYIKKIVYEYGLTYAKEDAIQECLIILFDCIKRYKMSSNSMFFTYYSVCVKHKVIKYLRLQTKYENVVSYNEQIDYGFSEDISLFDFKEKNVVFNSALEQNIYNEIFKGEMNIKTFAQKYNEDVKRVYNYIYKIRKKLKEIYK